MKKSVDDIAAEWAFRLDAGLSSAEQAELASWESAAPAHAAALHRQREAIGALNKPRLTGQSEYLLARLNGRAVRRRRIRTTAAGVAVLLVSGLLWFSRPASSPPSTGRSALILPEQQILPDGTVVQLKSGAKVAVSFVAASSSPRRVELLAGEAHFQVARDRERPFIVSARGVEFRAIGTAFSVQLGSEKAELLVTEGIVAVDRPANPVAHAGTNAVSSVTLATVTAGKRLKVDLAEPLPETPVAVSVGEIADALSWRVPRLEFTDTPLAEAVTRMNEHGSARLELADDSLSKVTVSGLFRADSTEAFVRILEANFGVQAEASGDAIRLRRKP